MSFRSVEEVGKWAELNGGVSALREAHAAQIFGDGHRVVACIEEWLRLQDHLKRITEDENNNELRVREVNAMEDTAASAKTSVIAAEKSAKWAMWAVFISVVALIIAILK